MEDILNIDETVFKIEESSYESDLLKQAVLYYKYASLTQKAKRDSILLKEQRDFREAELWKQLRDGGIKLTVKDREEEIPLDEKWKQLNHSYIEADYKARVLESVVEAICHKKDMLNTYCYYLRCLKDIEKD